MTRPKKHSEIEADIGHRKNKETHAGSSSISSTMRGAGRDDTTRPVAAGKNKAAATEIEKEENQSVRPTFINAGTAWQQQGRHIFHALRHGNGVM